MPQQGVILTPDDARVLRSLISDYRSKRPYVKPRLHRRAPVIGGSKCVTVYEIRMEGTVTGGTFDLDVLIDDGSSTSDETLTFDYDWTRAEVETEFETHTLISSGDISAIGGPLPNVSVYVVFLSSGTLNRFQALPFPDASSLTGTNAEVKIGYMTNANWEGG